MPLAAQISTKTHHAPGGTNFHSFFYKITGFSA
jgi:hypothetical protein